MDALMTSFWTGLGYSFGALMGLTCWLTLLRILWPTKPKKKWPPPLPPGSPGGSASYGEGTDADV
jgi:hypothetical protein